ncbi:alpha-mannosidase [Opitutaceae bacterium TAV3]|nr:alpha-mannosidase [Opitutaceae bacterium TAV3]
MRFHLIGNAHLDLVWLWDWREGLNESLITCRTLLRLMDEFPELTLIRGESTVYQYIQQHDPETFERIREHITTGRWDVVGGTLCQPDTNLPATETLNRHFTRGLDYMHRELGVRPRVAWSADSFGHSAGWPQIYAAAGMKYFACTRPFAADCPLPSPAFWWHGPGAERILSWRIPIRGYCTERREIAAVLDQYREQAPAWGLDNIAITYGLGNHGGGPTARHIRDILAWRDANPDIDVEFSTFHRFFAALAAEPKNHPTVQQELNFTLRGCYSSALRFKKNYRRTENLLSPAERTTTLVSAALDRPPPDLDAAWDSLLFNTFHDILPGTVIERAYDDQNAWLGVAVHDARRHELAALTALAARCDTRIAEPAPDMPSAVPVLLFNPHPYPLDTLAEVETCLEYRPIRAYKNRPDQLPVEAIGPDNQPIPFQLAPVENQFATEDPWRKRFLLPITIPPCGYQIVQVAWNETPRHAPPPPPPPPYTRPFRKRHHHRQRTPHRIRKSRTIRHRHPPRRPPPSRPRRPPRPHPRRPLRRMGQPRRRTRRRRHLHRPCHLDHCPNPRPRNRPPPCHPLGHAHLWRLAP